ncbi:MAG: class I SAM-dependent methyltransferase [Bacteroidales bacterium]|nr:class I SAM-dependent methyltransferase [Bacteroidales bacterium]
MEKEQIICQCCLNDDTSQFIERYKKNGFVVLECKKCSFNFIPPRYRENVTYGDYKSDDTLMQIRQGNNWLKVQRNLLRYKLIRKYKKSGTLFDLGVGWGHFLYTGRLLGYDVYGIEIANNPYIYAKNDLNLPVDQIDFFQMDKPDKSYDIITMWDVLEHIDKADLVIEKCSKLIKDNGYIIIQVPQIDSFIAKRQKESWTMMGLDHVNYFSKKNIPVILNRHGFDVVKIKSSIEFKLLLMFVVLPWVKKRKNKGQTSPAISHPERQKYFNKITAKPKIILKLFVWVHNIIYNILSFFNIGEEMIVVAKKRGKQKDFNASALP